MNSGGAIFNLDTNVFISAIFWRGLPNQLLNVWRAQRFQLIFSPRCLAELLAKLELKFDISPDQVKEWRRLLERKALLVTPTVEVKLCRDPADDISLEAALTGRADYIVTGDEDLLTLEEFQGIQIISPQQFWDLL